MPHVAQDEDQEARRQDEGEDDHSWSLFHQRGTADCPWPQPYRGGEGNQCGRPEQVEMGTEPAGARRPLVEGDDVPDRKKTGSSREEQGARRLSGHHHYRRKGERQQDEAADRSGQVHGYRNGGAADRTKDGGEGQRRADGRDAQAGDDAVEPEGRTDPSRPGAQEQHQRGAGQGVQQEREAVGDRGRQCWDGRQEEVAEAQGEQASPQRCDGEASRPTLASAGASRSRGGPLSLRRASAASRWEIGVSTQCLTTVHAASLQFDRRCRSARLISAWSR